MLRTLHGKLALALSALLALLGAAFVASTLYTSLRYQQEVSQKVNADLARRLVRDNELMLGAQVAEDELRAVVRDLAVTNPGVELYLLDSRGCILSASVGNAALAQDRVELGPVRRVLDDDPDPLVLGSNPRAPGRRKPFSAARIPADGPLQGYLYVVLSDAAQESAAGMVRGSYVLRLSVASGLAMLLLVFAAGFLTFRFLTRRLQRLALRMATFREEGRDEPDGASAAPARPAGAAAGGDEVAQLEAAFDDLTRRVSEQLDELARVDRLRREMLTNVSHDLRTPLSALRGYLETLQMKEGRLRPEEARGYLEVAAKHAERLEGLIAELFELARLDAGEAPAHPEPFPLPELVQDVAQKFQLAAERKDVRLRTVSSSSLPFVVADLGLIERVLTNLLDNALRHTPSGGEVRLTLRARDGALEVEVADTGPGIPAEKLPYVFDRFYRVEEYGGTAGQGAGLGLAIVKRVLELHGRGIEVVSRPEGGTAFHFSLLTEPAS